MGTTTFSGPIKAGTITKYNWYYNWICSYEKRWSSSNGQQSASFDYGDTSDNKYRYYNSCQ